MKEIYRRAKKLPGEQTQRAMSKMKKSVVNIAGEIKSRLKKK
jgi:hypothetical protein